MDSSTVLSWIRTPSRIQEKEIQETVGVDDFRYVRSKSNPADTLTRGTEPSRLTDWLEGPSFLHLPEEKWPDFQAEEQSSDEREAEVLKEMMTSEKASISAKPEVPVGDVNPVNPEAATTEANAKLEQVKSEDNPIFQKLLENCSTFPKIRRTLAYVLRFVQNTRKKN